MCGIKCVFVNVWKKVGLILFQNILVDLDIKFFMFKEDD